ncbi:MAG TPA: hypothetical protein VJB90_03300 [Candidatus Nanoarchaeia archaeon]|nr:hypothetical protein [Candidatus Nanoarchaeia archaeon]
MVVSYKQRCARCKKNMVLVTANTHYAVCFDCQKSELAGEIKDPQMKAMFNIPDNLYQTNSFLRSIKINYLRYGKLSDKQIEAFKKTVEKLKAKA